MTIAGIAGAACAIARVRLMADARNAILRSWWKSMARALKELARKPTVAQNAAIQKTRSDLIFVSRPDAEVTFGQAAFQPALCTGPVQLGRSYVLLSEALCRMLPGLARIHRRHWQAVAVIAVIVGAHGSHWPGSRKRNIVKTEPAVHEYGGIASVVSENKPRRAVTPDVDAVLKDVRPDAGIPVRRVNVRLERTQPFHSDGAIF